MKLTVLGCWAPYPRAGGACSGYLLQSGGCNMLIECGNGVLSNLQKHIDFRHLDAVIISHLHPDHYLDLYCLRHAVAGARRTDPPLKPLQLYMPSAPQEPFTILSRYTEAFDIVSIESLNRSQKNDRWVHEAVLNGNKAGPPVKAFFVKTDHPLPAYAVLIEGPKKFFYSADTKWCDYLPEFAAGADVALCEASVIEEDRKYTSVGHLTARQAGELAKQAGAGRLVITHFWPEYNLEILESEAGTGFGGPVTVAREGLLVDM